MGTIKGVSLIFGDKIGLNPLQYAGDFQGEPTEDIPQGEAVAIATVANDTFINADDSTDESVYKNLLNGKA